MKKILPLLFLNLALSVSRLAAEDAADFWRWFEPRSLEFSKFFSYENQLANQDSEEFQKLNAAKVQTVVLELQKVNPEFSAFFGYRGGRNKFTVTATGKTELFPEVDKLIAAAPKLKGWDFIALKQPLPLAPDTEIEVGSASFAIGDVGYTRAQNTEKPGTFDLVVYVPAKISDDPEGIRALVTQLAADLAGERLSATMITKITVFERNSTSPQNLLPFAEIHYDLSNAR